MSDSADLIVTIIGSCALSAEVLRDAYRRAAWPALIAARGDFVLIFDDPNGTTLVSSLYSVSPYFLGAGPFGFAHGGNVAAVVARAGLPPRLDTEALATLICAGHTVGTQSLIEGVQRIPARAVVRYRHGKLGIETFSWDDFHEHRDCSPERALEAFNAAVARVSGEDPVVSMSAGLDSRVILSSLLQARRKPALLTMGAAQSDDAQAAGFFAQRLGLGLTRRELAGADYLTEAAAIARLTDGQKTAEHWHSYFYVRGFQVNPDRRLLIGANGEFARNYYLDRRLVAQASAWGEIAPAIAKRLLWSAKLGRHNWAKRYGELLPAALRAHLDRGGISTMAARFAALSPGGLRDGLDRFYLDQRVRHFIGYGLRLIGTGAASATPFLDRDWVECAWNLKRAWKQNSNWHRFALTRNAPELLDYPESGYGGAMAPHLTPWQGMRRGRAHRKTPYVDYRALFRAPPVIDAVAGLQAQLTPIFGAALPARIIGDAKAGNPDPAAIGLMLALGHWRRGLEQQAADGDHHQHDKRHATVDYLASPRE